ncbi:MAG: alpha/beta hydrolase, partial [Campylobacteraceae bacterium]|nr:alpha/beta hydrolase [Campylobacteraceae bacterium]
MNSKEYAKVLKIWLDDLNIKPDLIVAHSFGGKLAALLNPPFLVLLSSAGILKPKTYFVRFKIVAFKLLKKIGLGKFYKFFASKDVSGMNQTMYETFKRVVDEDFRDIFSSYGGKALIFWGKKDKATPLEGGKKIGQLISNSTFYPLDGDHFFFLSHASFIAKTIKDNNVCSI